MCECLRISRYLVLHMRTNGVSCRRDTAYYCRIRNADLQNLQGCCASKVPSLSGCPVPHVDVHALATQCQTKAPPNVIIAHILYAAFCCPEHARTATRTRTGAAPPTRTGTSTVAQPRHQASKG